MENGWIRDKIQLNEKKKRSKSISRNRIVCFENTRYMKNKPKDLPRSATYDAAKNVH